MESEKNKFAKFSGKEINSIFKSFLQEEDIFSIFTDSRENINGKKIFFPFAGEKYDGHNFVNEIIEKEPENTYSIFEKGKISLVKKEYQKNLIFIDSTVLAFNKLANYYRRKINPTVIAITGSAGKTTTKEMLFSILSLAFKVHKTEKNNNNEIGVPKTILEMPAETQILILEMGMRGLGEIELLSQTAQPNIAILTCIGTAHIGRLGSKEKIIQAKLEIVKHLQKEGILFFNADTITEEQIEKYFLGRKKGSSKHDVKEKTLADGKTIFNYKNKVYEINTIGDVYISNALLVLDTAYEIKQPEISIKNGLSNFKIPQGHGNLMKFNNEIFIIDGTYNASPESVKEAANELINGFSSNYKKIFILGTLKELGEQEEMLLKETAEQLKKLKIDKIIIVDANIQPYLQEEKNVIVVNTLENCYNYIENELSNRTVITIKGSRVANMEKIVEYLSKKVSNANKN